MRGFTRALLNASMFGLALLAASAFAQTPPAAPSAVPSAVPPAVPSYIGQHASTAEDLRAITAVTEQFRAALLAKNTRQLSSLLFSANILFTSPADDKVAQSIRDTADVNFDGISGAGVSGFLSFVGNSPKAIEERFYNLQIVQDGHVATVTFDYDFLMDGQPQNHGIESWQLYKTEGNWKIISIVWSSHAAAN
jgi:hypothetical protein